METPRIDFVEFSERDAAITVFGMPDHAAAAYQVLAPIAHHELNVDILVQSRSEESGISVTFIIPRWDYERALEITRSHVLSSNPGATVQGREDLAKVCVRGLALRSHTLIARTIFETLASHAINIRLISTSELKTSVLVDNANGRLAAHALSRAFGARVQRLEDEPVLSS